MSWQINKKRLINDVSNKMSKGLSTIGTRIKNAMISEINSNDITGATEWNNQVRDAIDFIVIDSALKVGMQVGMVNSQNDEDLMYKALLINYGIGRDLDKENPWLDEYKNSEYYNKNRQNYEVLSRPGERIYDPTTGQWKESEAKSIYEIEQFHQSPVHFFENSIRLIQSEIQDIIEETWHSIDLSDYLESR